MNNQNLSICGHEGCWQVRREGGKHIILFSKICPCLSLDLCYLLWHFPSDPGQRCEEWWEWVTCFLAWRRWIQRSCGRWTSLRRMSFISEWQTQCYDVSRVSKMWTTATVSQTGSLKQPYAWPCCEGGGTLPLTTSEDACRSWGKQLPIVIFDDENSDTGSSLSMDTGVLSTASERVKRVSQHLTFSQTWLLFGQVIQRVNTSSQLKDGDGEDCFLDDLQYSSEEMWTECQV